MDIAATSVLAYKLAQGQQNMGMAMLKQAVQGEAAVANTIMENAVQAVASADGSRGNNLDITV
ncbi:MAG TPA: hypothetical protein VIN59_01830 [Alphaproteobacteria bacterium]